MLARRAVVARAVATDAYGRRREGKATGRAGRRGRGRPAQAREPPRTNCRPRWRWSIRPRCPLALVAELADAEARVLLARRFHNDAVRDTLALRERPLVRLLHLGGTAAMPTYFEIAERRTRWRRAIRAPAHVGAPGAARRERRGAAVLRVGPRRIRRAVLGAAVVVHRRRAGRHGESLTEAAARELAEETGLRVDPADLIGPVWRRDAVFDFNGAVIAARRSSSSTARCGSSRRPRAAPSWRTATSTATGGATRPTSPSWPQPARRSIRFSSAELLTEAVRWPAPPDRPASCNPSAESDRPHSRWATSQHVGLH